jgi:hypothetical protein
MMTVETALQQPALPGVGGLKPGCAHIIDLCTVRSTMGALWPAMQDGVRGRLEAVMARRLSQSDHYQRLDDERYLLVTPDAQGNEGMIFTLRVMSEFLSAMNGSCDLGDIRIETAESDGGAIRGVPVSTAALVKVVEKANLSDITLPPQLRAAAHQPEKEIQKAAAARRSALTAVHRFEPVWDAPHQAITTYICAPQTITCPDTPDIELTMADLTVRERTAIELAGLVKGVGYLSKFLESGDRFLLCITVSFETLCSPYGRTEFARTCRGLPAVYRQYLVFLLTDVPLGVTHSRLTDLAVVIKPFGRIIASVASGCRNFASYTGHGFNGLALDLAKAQGDLERKRADIVYVGAAGHSMKWGAAILNLDDPELLSAVNAADFRFLHGKIVATPVAEPKRMTRLESNMVFPESNDAGSEEWF